MPSNEGHLMNSRHKFTIALHNIVSLVWLKLLISTIRIIDINNCK